VLSIKIRIIGTIFIPFFILIWWIPTNGVWGDYQDLLNQVNKVQLSLITLLVPVGGLGALIIVLIQFPVAVFYGKKISEIFSEKSMQLANKICIYSVLLGVISAITFTFYSMNLLNEYGYKYSYELTRITPTGIHLMYVKTP
jgi:hypothetical protein